MSIWETEIFAHDAVAELFDDIEGLDPDTRAEALADACRIAVGAASESERQAGLAAAVVVAIWAGAPYSSGEMTDEYSFITEGIGHTSEGLVAAASEVFEKLGDDVDESTGAFLEDYSEAVE